MTRDACPHRRPRALALGFALTTLLSGGPPLQPRPGQDRYPAYTPVTTLALTPAQLLVQQAAWIRNQVWASGPVADAGTYLIPRSYDVTSGYGFLDTDYFSWLLDHNASYARYDATHDLHRADVPRDRSNDAPIERVMMAWGANRYDTAVWAVAMAAAGTCRPFTREARADFTDAVNAYLRFLVTGSYPGGLQSYRAFDVQGNRRWRYGESGLDAAWGQGPDPRNAYGWQYAPPRWQNPDPHWDPAAPPGAVMNWPAWSVVTGEEAWATFLGPMQVAYVQGGGRPGWAGARSPVDALALVGNACRLLGAVTLMRNAATGGIYRNVRPPDTEDGPQWFDVSLENNWSMYTGLGYLERALGDLEAHPPAEVLDFDLAGSLAQVRSLREGQRSFFLDRARVWHAQGEPFGDPRAVPFGFFLQGTTGRAGAAKGVTDAFAADVQTWGLAAILADRELEAKLEAVCGRDFLWAMFQSAVGLAGYRGPDGSLAGIGFTAQGPGDPEAVLSGEWTWGAVNAAVLLADFYREPGRRDPVRAEALLATARALGAGVNRLCTHQYNPQRLGDGRDWAACLYANRRTWIPWGWFANACPSQAATCWSLLVNCGFNPFELGGGEHQATVKALGLAGR